MYEYCAKLLKVIDGDTVEAQIDLGFNIYTTKRIRLMNIDAPETRTKDKLEKIAGKRAKDRLIDIFKQNNDYFTFKSHGIGKFGRCLGEIFIKNKSVSDILLSEGLVKKYKDR